MTIPFGSPVLPDVKVIYAGCAGLTSGKPLGSTAKAFSASPGISGMLTTRTADERRGSTSKAASPQTRTKLGSSTWMICSMRERG
ncbi:hypothetical protein D3C72_2107020 [compost metagenome]